MSNQTPHNLEVEQALLGALLIDCRDYDRVGHILTPDSFFEGVHGSIYEYIATNMGKGKKIDAITAKNWFETQGQLKAIGGVSYLANLQLAACDVDVVEDYANEVKQYYQRRELASKSAELSRKCLDLNSESIETHYAEFEGAAAELFSANSKQEFATASAVVLQYVKDLKKPSQIGIETGFTSLDRTIGQINKGYVWTVGARPAMGKSAFALSVAENVARKGKGVFFLSMDMAQDQVATRLLSMTMNGGHEYRNLIQSRMDNATQALANEAALQISLPIVFDNKRGRHVDELLSTIRRAKRHFEDQGIELGLVVIDHLQKVRPLRTRGNDYSEASETIRRLKDGAMQLDTAFMVLSQLNRSVEARQNKRPLMSDLRETGAIEEESDIVTMLYRPAYYLRQQIEEAHTDDEKANLFLQLEKSQRLLEVLNPKVRQGEPAPVYLDIDIGTNRIFDNQTPNRNYY